MPHSDTHESQTKLYPLPPRTTLGHYKDSKRKNTQTFPIDVRMPCLMNIAFTDRIRLFVTVTPIDTKSCWLVARYYAEYPLGGLIAWLVGKFEAGKVQDQDKAVLATLREGPVEKDEYVYGKPDKGSVWWANRRRKMIAEHRAKREGDKRVLPVAATDP